MSEELPDPLLEAIDKNDKKAVEDLIAANVNLEEADVRGQTPLMRASGKGFAEIVKLLLGAKANVNATKPVQSYAGIYGLTALHYAVGSKEKVEVVKLLLDAGADVNAVAAIQRPKPLESILFQNMSEAGPDYDFGNTPLHLSVHSGSEEIVKLLLEKGARWDAKDGKSRTARYWAEGLEQPNIAKILLDAEKKPLPAQGEFSDTELRKKQRSGIREQS